jgi:hypothetical protein
VTIFRIATFVNDQALYERMRASFEASGFTNPVATYTVETGDPYQAINRLSQDEAAYVLLAHQDVVCDQGVTAETLEETLAELTRIDPSWSIAGNAGLSLDAKVVRHLDDRWGSDRRGDVPVRVASLDENALILRNGTNVTASPDIGGFHLYGVDVCLHAAKAGRTAYVVDLPLTHLGRGSTAGFDDAIRRFQRSWASRIGRPSYVKTITGYTFGVGPKPLLGLMENKHVMPRLATRYPAVRG